MTVETHWWGVEVIFTKEEKEKIIKVGDLLGAPAGAGALAEALGLTVGVIEAPLLAVIAAILALIVADLVACNIVGKGGFRICITWLVITLPPPIGTLTLAPQPVF